MTEAAAPAARERPAAFDRLGVVIALIGVAGALTPFAAFRANRIVPGEGLSMLASLPAPEGMILAAVVAAVIAAALLRVPTPWKLGASLGGLAAILVFIGRAASFLTPEGDTLARVSPGTGFWLLLAAFALLAAHAATRARLSPFARLGLLAFCAIALAAIVAPGTWNDVSVLKEYAARADSFWREAGQHVLLAFGSLVAAVVAGLPLGVLSYRWRPLRVPLLNVLNIIQTVPSIALFGLLIAPLGWLAASFPAAAALGISGIGAAPAMVALFGYSLLPMVANTVVGLEGVPAASRDAARGMGMTVMQRLIEVEMPLALPVILTGIRIVLVQNIGLATIAALIGGGGLGVFVFQGMGQTAMDLVLLGAAPTVLLAFASAVVLDALVEMLGVSRGSA